MKKVLVTSDVDCIGTNLVAELLFKSNKAEICDFLNNQPSYYIKCDMKKYTLLQNNIVQQKSSIYHFTAEKG